MKKINHAIVCLALAALLAGSTGCAQRSGAGHSERSYIAMMMIRGRGRDVTKDQTVCGDLARFKRWRTTRDLALMEIIDAQEKGNRDRIGVVSLYDLSKSQIAVSREFFPKLGFQPAILNNGIFTFRAARVPKGTVIELEKIIAIESYNIQFFAYAKLLPSKRRVAVDELFYRNPDGPGPWGSVSPNPDYIEPETAPSR